MRVRRYLVIGALLITGSAEIAHAQTDDLGKLLTDTATSFLQGDTVAKSNQYITRARKQMAAQDYQGASLTILKAARIMRGAVGVRSPEYASLLTFSGYIHARAGKNDNAIRLYEAGLNLAQDNGGGDNNDYISALLFYLRFLIEIKNVELADIYWTYFQNTYENMLANYTVDEAFQQSTWRNTLANDGLIIYRSLEASRPQDARRYRDGAFDYCRKIRPAQLSTCSLYAKIWDTLIKFYQTADMQDFQAAASALSKVQTGNDRILEMFLVTDTLGRLRAPEYPFMKILEAQDFNLKSLQASTTNLGISYLKPSVIVSRAFQSVGNIEKSYEHAVFAADVARVSLSNNLLASQHDLTPEGKAFDNLLDISNTRGRQSKSDYEQQFLFSQVLRAQQNADFLNRLTSRLASRDNDLGRKLKERERMNSEREALKRQAATAMTIDYYDSIVPRQKALQLFREEQALVRELEKQYGNMSQIVNPEPLDFSEARKYLHKKEALLHFYQAERGQIYSWWIDDKAVESVRVRHDPGEIGALIQRLRDALTPARADEAFDTAAAHRLYEILLAPYESRLAKTDHLFIVPDGDLESLPFNVLRIAAPDSGSGAPNPDEWFGLSQAYSSIPAPSTLRVLRGLATKIAGEEPFAGFGDPLLSGALDRLDDQPRSSLFRGEMVDSNEIRKLPPLPNSARELKQISSSLGGDPRNVYTGADATESHVKDTDLQPFAVLAFATHGLLNGGDSGFSEPGLVFTPPATPSMHDDGYLSTSEIANLQTDASWIILSACNTATAEGGRQQGLSSIANAFFLSGSRGLLATHWQVQSEAAEKLTTNAFSRMKKNKRMRMSEAMRLSMIDLSGDPDFSHPLYWAPFAVVGGGIAGR